MIRPTTKLLLLLSSIAIVSCGSGENVREIKSSNAETPKALADDNSEIISVKRAYSNSIVTELYQELVEKSPALQNLEEDLKNTETTRAELAEKFGKYNNKSTQYYSDAEYVSLSITDSLLKQRIKSIIDKSINSNKVRLSDVTSLNEQIIKNTTSVKDLHLAMTIVLTVPLIEKYQNDNKPDKKEFNDLIKEQNKNIFSLDSVVEKK